ncbi:hypothetical protein COD93_29690 [Bacillus cereus]|nr:hypothetical protein CN499_06475 [Bacillus thuringiensis]PGV23041.1 hypothetical protein COD93_29690 [Bacillus cereus]
MGKMVQLKNKPKAALSQVEYLESKYAEINEQISGLEEQQKETEHDLHELYFQKGKIFADLELMKRVPEYED